MHRNAAPFASLLTLIALGAGCSSEDPGGNGLVGGATGTGAKGGTTGSGGTTGATTGSGGGIAAGGSKSSGTGGTIIVSGGTSSGGSSTGGTGAGGTMNAGGACTGNSATGMKGAAATLLFVVDTSLSMNDRVGMSTKIAATKLALDQSFMDLDAGLDVGLFFFPHEDVGAATCFDPTVEVPIGPLDAAQRTLLTTQVDGVMAGGSTPTHDAYAFAVQTLTAAAQTDRTQYIVLITDGIPTYALGCMGTGLPNQTPAIPTQPLIDAAQAAFMTNGIKTFVVGSPGSEGARSLLSAMARVGGTGPAGCSDTGPTYCHFDMTMTTDVAASLQAALGTISEQIPVDCNFALPKPPSGMMLDLDKVNVTVTHDGGMQVPIARDPNGDCATEGWRYVGDPPTAVELCGSLCDAVKAETAPTIDVQFGCSQRVNPPR